MSAGKSFACLCRIFVSGFHWLRKNAEMEERDTTFSFQFVERGTKASLSTESQDADWLGKYH